jgi:hypothetical protein
MPQFEYTVTVAGGGEQSGRISASTEAEACKTLAKRIQIVDWLSIKPVRESVPAPSKPLLKKKSATPKVRPSPVPPFKQGLRKLDKLLEKQHGRCFFCDQLLARADASIEHLLALSHGGQREDSNEVACHRTINQKMGSIPLKDKFEFILKVQRDAMCDK